MTLESGSQPSHVLWQRLLDAASALRVLAPWRWMTPRDRFAVRHPDTGVVAYACIEGRDGAPPGLGFHIGAVGLEGLERLLRAPAVAADPLEALEIYVAQDALAVTYDDGLEAEPPDPEWAPRTVRAAEPLRPHFRAHRPGCDPWPLTRDEAAFLAVALEQSLVVARRLRRPDVDVAPPAPGLILARVADPTLDGMAWRDAWLEVAAPPPLVAEAFEIDARRWAALRALPRLDAVDVAGTWEVEYTLSPIAVQDSIGVRPRYTYRVVVAAPRDGRVVAADEVEHDARHGALREAVLRAVEARGARPASLRCRRRDVAAALTSLAACLDVPLARVEALEAGAAPSARRATPLSASTA